jgi:putative selenate reductase
MADKFYIIPIEGLFQWILNEEKNGSIFGIPKELFFTPSPQDPFRMERYQRILETPLGVAAGPHTQMAQNIITAWLTGARYMELKTVQTLDELDVSKPCIDMEDEGYKINTSTPGSSCTCCAINGAGTTRMNWAASLTSASAITWKVS